MNLIGQMSCDHTFVLFGTKYISTKSMTAKFVAPLSPKFRGHGNHIWKSLPHPLRARSATALVLNFNVLGWYTCVPSFMLLPQSARLVQLSAGLSETLRIDQKTLIESHFETVNLSPVSHSKMVWKSDCVM